MTYVVYMLSMGSFILGVYEINRSKKRRLRDFISEENLKKRLIEVRGIVFKRYLEKKRRAQVDREIFQSISYLRNIIVVGRENDIGIDYVLQVLCDNDGILKEAFVNMLSFVRLNRIKEAEEVFNKYAGTDISGDFCRLILKWDEIPQKDLLETLISYEKSIKEAMITDIRRQDEIISNLIYIPVVINVILIFIDFLCVSFFIEQREMLNNLF